MEEWNETQNGSSKNSLYRSGTWKPLCWKMPIPFSSSNTQLYSQILYLLLDCGAGRKVAICSSHIVSASLSSSHSSPHPVWNISCGRQSSPISPTWVLPMGFISSLTAPSWVFFPRPQICQACQQTYSSTKFYIHEAIAPTRSMLWHEFSYFWAFPCSSMGSCKCSRWTSALWAGGAQLPHHGLHQRLQRYLCSSAWSTFSSFSLLILGFSGLFLSHILTHFSVAIAPVRQRFSLSQVCFPSSTAAVPNELSSDQLQVHQGARWHWLLQTPEKFLAASVALFFQKLVMQTQWWWC